MKKNRSQLHAELAARILRSLHHQGVGVGHHLVEQDLCRQLGVSRTPVRGALQLLAEQGCVQARANRGFILLEPVDTCAVVEPVHPQEQRDRRLFAAIAAAYNRGTLPAQFTQQQLVRLFGTGLPPVLRVLHRMAELGLAQRKPGTGWFFTAALDPARTRSESCAFRRAIEPAILLQPSFVLDGAWAQQARMSHLSLRRAPWRTTRAAKFLEVNSKFHEQLARCSGNAYMLGAVQQQLQLQSFINDRRWCTETRVHAAIDEHLAILEALEENRHRDAAMMMQGHLLGEIPAD